MYVCWKKNWHKSYLLHFGKFSVNNVLIFILLQILQKKKMELLEDNNNEIGKNLIMLTIEQVKKLMYALSDGTTEKRKGFLDRLLELRDMDKLSDQDICDEVNTLIVGVIHK